MSKDFPFKDEDFQLNVTKSQASTLFSLFQFGASVQKKSNQGQDKSNQEQNKYTSYFSKFKEQITQKTSSTISSLTSKGQEAQNIAGSWQYFLLFFILGLIFLSMSFMYLPFIVIMPSKFSSSFALGSFCIMISMALIKGPSQFLQSLFSKDKMVFSAAYLITLGGTLYYSIFDQNYFFVLFFSLSQIFSLMWLVGSSFPGGIAGMKFITSQMISCFKGCFGRLIGNKNSSYLPI